MFKLLCKKNKKQKKAACLIPLWEAGPLAPWFSPGAGKEAEARVISLSLTASEGEH